MSASPVKHKQSIRKNSTSPVMRSRKVVHCLTDEELRAELTALGANVGPITTTTRAVYEKQLEKRRRNSMPSGSPNVTSRSAKNVEKEYKLPTESRASMSARSLPHSSSSAHSSESFARYRNVLEGTYSSVPNYSKFNIINDQNHMKYLKKSSSIGNDSRDSDDDHMESSRIITPMYGRKQSMSNSFSVQSKLAKCLKFWISFISPRRSSSRSPKFYRSFPERNLHSFSEEAFARNIMFGLDISQVLLLLFLFLFGFLLIAYLATANSGVLIQNARLVYVAAKDTVCFLYSYAILPLLIFGVACGIATGVYMLRQYQLKKKAAEKRLVFDLIEKITDIVREANEQGQVYVAEPHVRDMLLTPSQRMRDSPEWCRWQEAVKFINLNESRVSTETRIINGVECSVWRWIPAKKNGWQGSAFDGSMRLRTSDQAPSHCLKLRGMFSSSVDSERTMNIVDALKQKIAPIQPLHIHIEKDSKEGVVFARFASLSDCSRAFKALHGTWFNSQLVWAKFLRDERYEQRFPNAPRQ